jgi:hypothetical protein
MIPQLIEERPHASATLLDPLWCVKCAEGAGRTEPKDQEAFIRLTQAGAARLLPVIFHDSSRKNPVLSMPDRLLDSFVHASVKSNPSDRQ